MPTLADLGGSSPQFVTLGDIGRYIPTTGMLAGPARGSPGGLPQQAREVSPFVLTRERIQRELEDNPALARTFDVNTTAEVGSAADARRKYQATVIDRAVQQGRTLGQTVNDPNYYPDQTLAARRGAGYDVDPALWEGANPASFATGNASYDPKTGRNVGFAGGPQTAISGSGRGAEWYGIEGPAGLEYARIMGYGGPSRTTIGPSGPRGDVVTEAPLPPAGWQAGVGIEQPTSSGGVGYTAQNSPPTQPATAAPRGWGDILADVAANFHFKPKQVKLDIPQMQFSQTRFTPIGNGGVRG